MTAHNMYTLYCILHNYEHCIYVYDYTGNGGALQRPAKDYTAINDSIRARSLFDKEGPGLTDEEISGVEAEVDSEAATDKTVL